MTTALYRRYRPQDFADVIGQEHVTEPLMQALKSGRIGHAYLFSGPRGCGKTTSARILARCLNCEQGPTATPCGECESCVALATGGSGSVDVIEIDAASHGGVDDARDLREKAAYGPANSRYKVYIIDEAHMVTPQGFNALLKIVEEPPEHVKFVFATTEPEKVIGTIRSRTHHYPFRLVPPARLQDYLEELCARENVQVEPGVLSFVVRAGGGSVRDSLSVLDQLIAGSDEAGLTYAGAAALLGFTEGELLDACVDALAAGDGAGVFRQVDRVIETGQDPRRFVEDLLERFRDLIVLAAVSQSADAEAATSAVLRGIPEDQITRMRQQAGAFGPGQLSYAADVINAGLTEMTGATSPRLQLELLCARLLLPTGAGEHGYSARLDRLERRLDVGGGIAAPIPGQDASSMPAPRPESGGRWASNEEAHTSASGGPGRPHAQDERADGGGRGRPERGAPGAGDRQAPPVGRQGAAQDGAADGGRPDGQVGRDGGAQHSAGPQGAPDGQASRDERMSQPQGRGGGEDRGAHPHENQGGRDDARHGRAESGRPGSAQPGAGHSRGAQAADPQQGRSTPPAGPRGGVDTEMIRRNWPDVLQRIFNIRRVTWTFLSEHAQVLDYDGTRLLLGLSTKGLATTFRNGPHSEVVRQALSEALGIDTRVEGIPASDAPAARGGYGGRPTPGGQGDAAPAGAPRHDRGGAGARQPQRGGGGDARGGAPDDGDQGPGGDDPHGGPRGGAPGGGPRGGGPGGAGPRGERPRGGQHGGMDDDVPPPGDDDVPPDEESLPPDPGPAYGRRQAPGRGGAGREQAQRPDTERGPGAEGGAGPVPSAPAVDPVQVHRAHAGAEQAREALRAARTRPGSGPRADAAHSPAGPVNHDDDVSVDDEDIADAGAVGQPVIASVLGGVVIAEEEG